MERRHDEHCKSGYCREREVRLAGLDEDAALAPAAVARAVAAADALPPVVASRGRV